MLRAAQLYTFLQHCEATSLPKEVLECGAGGWPGFTPLFARFAARGYTVHGIEISEKRLEHAQAYCATHGIEADLRVADMRHLPFPDASLPFVFSYNAIFHMTKADIACSIREISRVLMPGGHCFINSLHMTIRALATGKKWAPANLRTQCRAR